MSGNDGRIALLVGAGLSANAGLPMSVGLAERLKEKLTELINIPEATPEARKDRERAKHWLALLHFLNGGVRFQEGILNRDPGGPVNIEQIAIAAEELYNRTSNPLAAYTAGWHKRIDELEELDPEILRSFVDFTYGLLQTELQNPKDVSYLERLKDLCTDSHGVDIFTLNYDLCIEKALGKASTPFANGFNKDGVWSPETFSTACPLKLFKLHGSLDWVDDVVYGLCALECPRHTRADTIQGDETRPHLIFGTAHKLSAREPFLTLAYHFSQATLQSRILAVVGYSFGDEHVNQMIEQGMKKNATLRIIVSSPNPERTIKKHRVLESNPRVSTIRGDAETVLNKGLLRDEIRKLTTAALDERPF